MTTNGIIAIIAILIGLIVFLWMLFRPKKEITTPFPKKWRKILIDKVQFYNRLNAEEKARFEKSIQRFLHEVRIVPVEVEITDVDRMLVASSAVITVFGYPDWEYRNISEVLLYKASFDRDYNTEGGGRNIIGMVGSGNMNRTMILTQKALHDGFEKEGSTQNVGIHEFIHLLDKSDGTTDGVPGVFLGHYTEPWLEVVHAEIKKILSGESNINPYGAKNEAEFLSVISEYYFNQPAKLKEHHPALYEQLAKVFRQDLA